MNRNPKYDNDLVTLGYLKDVFNVDGETITDLEKLIPKSYASPPTPPYYVGSILYYEHAMYRCKTERKVGNFNWDDWVVVATDNNELVTWIETTYAVDQAAVQEQVDKKVETYYQSTDPNDWTTDIEKAKHVGDFWYNTTNNTQWRWSQIATNPITYAWRQVNVPDAVFDLIDTKKSIYVSKPTSYNENDLWIIELDLPDADLPEGTVSNPIVKGDWVFATQDSTTYDKTHWVKLDEDVKVEYLQQHYSTTTEVEEKIANAVTTSNDNTTASVSLSNITTSEPVVLKIHPITDNISYLYPRDNLYPSDDLYMTDRTVRFYNTKTGENFYYTLPDDLLKYDSENYDEFELDYNKQTCKVIKKCKYNADGSVGLLQTPTTNNYTYPTITLTKGNYTILLPGYSNGYIFATLMVSNSFTDQFYTKPVVTATIDQKIIDNNNAYVAVEVAKKVNTTDYTKASIVAKINDNTSQVQIEADNIDLTGYLTVSSASSTYANKSSLAAGTTTINGGCITTGEVKSTNYVANTSGTKIDLSNGAIDSKNFKLDSNGNGTFKGLINGGSISVQGGYDYDDPYVEVKLNDNVWTRLWNNGISSVDYSGNSDARIRTEANSGYAELHNSECNAFAFNNISLAEKKENFEKLQNALDIIKQTDIYKFNYKKEKRNKKHIGLVIGDKYNYSKELTNEENNAVDLYSMVGVCLQAIKEQQEEIEKLKEMIK